MGDRFALVRLDSDGDMRRKAGKQAMANVNYETTMRTELSEAAGDLLGSADVYTRIKLDESETDTLLAMADLVTRARTAVERDYQGNPMFAHGLEMPTRFAKQLVQIMQGGLSLGMSRDYAMRAAERCARDTMPPLRRVVLADVAQHPNSFTPDVADRVQIPKTTVDRTLQELQLLGLLRVDHIPYGESERIRWQYSLAPGIDQADLAKCTRNVSKGA